MKIKHIYDRKTKSRCIAVRLGRGETFEYEQAQWLASRPDDRLLPFTYLSDRGETVLYYDVTDTVPLSRYLKGNALSGAQYRCMLCSLHALLALITRRLYATAALWCDPSDMFVASGGELRFMYVPLAGLATTARSTPIALLTYLADMKKVSFAVDDDSRRALSLKDFVCRHPVLSLTDFEAYLSEEYGIDAWRSTDEVAHDSSSLGFSSKNRSIVSGGLQKEPSRICSTSKVPEGGSFDAVALLSGFAGAAQVVAGQNAARRVLDGVGGYSPTSRQRVISAVRATGAFSPEAVCDSTPTKQDDDVKGSTDEPVGRKTHDARAEQTTRAKSFDSATSSLTACGAAGDDDAGDVHTSTDACLLRLATGERCAIPHVRAAIVGRSSSCDIPLSGNTNISRRHGSISLCDNGVEFEDLGSANGSFAYGERIIPHVRVRLHDGDTLRLADEDFALIVRGASK